jgi:hypothetical protein
MNEQTTKLIQQLAEKLGTTAEHLWVVLIKQAGIAWKIDLIEIVAMIAIACWAYKFIRKKAAKSEWEDEEIFWANILLVIFCVITLAAVMIGGDSIITAIFNPEFWALNKILITIK